MLNRVEAGIRAFDPCLSCSTHAFGQMPLHVRLIRGDGTLVAEAQPRERRPVNPPLLIGYGNPFCGDDGVGPLVTAACAEAFPDIETIIVHQLAPELAEPISHAACVVFVDAELGSPGADSGSGAGPRGDGRRGLTHHFHPAVLLACARLLFGRCPPAHLVTVGGADFGPGDKLSAAVQAAVPAAVARVAELIGSSGPL